MGFRIVSDNPTPPIRIEDLDSQMIFDLINCYDLDYSPADVECRVPAHHGDVKMVHYVANSGGGYDEIPYPNISKETVQEFYNQLDDFRDVVRDIIIGDFHTGNKVIVNGMYYTDGTLASQEDINNWVWGSDNLSNIDDIKYWTFFIINRDFGEKGKWMYTLTDNDIDSLKSFIYSAVDLFIQANDHGDLASALQNIRAEYHRTT